VLTGEDHAGSEAAGMQGMEDGDRLDGFRPSANNCEDWGGAPDDAPKWSDSAPKRLSPAARMRKLRQRLQTVPNREGRGLWRPGHAAP
jgi:hypothetical protein